MLADIDTTPLVNAIAIVETDNRPVGGDYVDGVPTAISPWQIHRPFWQDVHAKFPNVDIGARWEDIGWPDQTSVLRARNCATCGVLMITEYLEDHGQPPTPENIYACYTIGRAGFHGCNFDLKSPDFPEWKRHKCHRVANLVKQLTPAD